MGLTLTLLCFIAPCSWSVVNGENLPKPNQFNLNHRLVFQTKFDDASPFENTQIQRLDRKFHRPGFRFGAKSEQFLRPIAGVNILPDTNKHRGRNYNRGNPYLYFSKLPRLLLFRFDVIIAHSFLGYMSMRQKNAGLAKGGLSDNYSDDLPGRQKPAGE